MKRTLSPTPENVRSALCHVSPSCDRETWVRVLAAIKNALGNDGRSIADEWSQQGDSYNKVDFRDTWKSIRASGKVTVATLWRLALDAGWKPDEAAREETEAERLERERQRAARAEREAKARARKEKDAARKANALWKAASPAKAEHPYLTRKAINPVPALREIPVDEATAILEYAPKSDDEPLVGRLLVVPVKIDGKLTTAELIDEAGRKAAIAGGPKSGGLWAAQALPKGDGAGLTLLIGEGVATVLTAKAATGHPAIAALSAGNLPKVATALKERHPAARLVILGDIGGGLKYAQQAAKATGAALAVPEFTPEQVEAHQGEHGHAPTDFNDLAGLAGLAAVRVQLEKALATVSKPDPRPSLENAGVTDVTAVTANNGAASSRYGGFSDDVTDVAGREAVGDGGNLMASDIQPSLENLDVAAVTSVTANNGAVSSRYGGFSGDVTDVAGQEMAGGGGGGTKSATLVPFPNGGKKPRRGSARHPDDSDPDEPQRPSYVVYENWSKYGPPGVVYHGWRSARKDQDPEPLNVWVCSPLYVEGVSCGEDGHGFGRLLRFRNTFEVWRFWAMPMRLLGGSCEELRRELLDAGVHLEHQERARLADYLQSKTPERRILAATRTGWTRDGGAFVLPERVIGNQDVYYQSESFHQYGEAEAGGDFGTWKNEVAARCVGNQILMLSVCLALAGPLLTRVRQDSGGLHLHCDSSAGKSTSLHVACSIWGGEHFRRTWKGTANGFEGVAAARNDTFLPLDEINQANPAEVGDTVYMLGNETGKQRAHRGGSAREVHRWRLTVLSTGEKNLETFMAEAGKKPTAGQLVRLLNVPVARTFGAFDDLHGFPGGKEFADHLKACCEQHYGHAGPAFVDALLKDGRDFGAALTNVVNLPQFKGDNGQESRGAARFALYGMAGELAVEWGILPWPEGEAMKAAAEGFRLWREARGVGMTEDRQILQAVRDFLSRHGDSRFSDKDKQAPVIHRAGWWTQTAPKAENGEEDAERIFLFTPDGLKEATKGYDFERAKTALDMAGWIVARGKKGERSKNTRCGGRQERVYWVLPGDLGE